jgi:hypothetical protein
MLKRVRFLMLLIPTLALAAPAFGENADLRFRGSALVFPKFIRGTVALPEGGTAPATELEIGVVCPTGVTCSEDQTIKIRFHWVCGSSEANLAGSFVCAETDFDVTATVWEKIVLTPDGSFPGVSSRIVPAAQCPRGYLIGWVINDSDQPIKFDGLIGDAVLRESGTAEASYDAVTIQAFSLTPNLQPIGTVGGPLVFDGTMDHYRKVPGRIFGDIRYANLTAPPTFTTASITLLTLDVNSNRPNNPVFVDLAFFGGNSSAIGNENGVSTFTEFICWTEQRIVDIDANLTTTLMGREGVFASDAATKVGIFGIDDKTGPVTLLGLVETMEGPTPGSAAREYIATPFNDGVGVPTCFVPGDAVAPLTLCP